MRSLPRTLPALSPPASPLHTTLNLAPRPPPSPPSPEAAPVAGVLNKPYIFSPVIMSPGYPLLGSQPDLGRTLLAHYEWLVGAFRRGRDAEKISPVLIREYNCGTRVDWLLRGLLSGARGGEAERGAGWVLMSVVTFIRGPRKTRRRGVCVPGCVPSAATLNTHRLTHTDNL